MNEPTDPKIEPEVPVAEPEAPIEPEVPTTEPVVPDPAVDPDPVDPEADPDPVDPVEPPEPTEPAPSKRENLRIQSLISKLKNPQGTPPQERTTGIDYSKSLEADPEVISRLEADRKAFGEDRYNQGLEQAKSIQFHTRLEIDAPRVESKYPQLDPSSKTFNPAVANAINEWYLASSGYDEKTDRVANSNIRYSDFVESIFELGDEISRVKTAESSVNIAKQAASTALRPGGATKRLNLDQAPEDMTDEELKAKISQSLRK